MTLDIPDEDLPLFVRALEHYHAYLVATQREDARLTAYAERLKRKGPDAATRKTPARSEQTARRKR